MSNINNSKFYIRLPLLLSVALAGGIFIGATMFGGSTNMSKVIKGVDKIKEILMYIDRDYVDAVNTEELVDYSIEKMLEKLDPHTAYIPPKDITMARSQLEGDFDGIGIEFNIFKDTVYVVAPINGGPSEAVGLQAGDKIVTVDGIAMTGNKIDNAFVFGKLRGKKGSQVKLGITRKGSKEVKYFTVTRDKIPQFSIDATFMVDAQTGYIKVNRFAANTYEEFKSALTDLKAQGMKQLVLDLRGNPGGYMDRATNMADELIGGDKLIVYTNGKDTKYDSQTKAYKDGLFEKGPVIVLVDEGSASASEIVSGALQDDDRALIVGRRTFGKGLVQMPITLSDGSELRLTISRYYTPSGRSIQKPYAPNKGEEYDTDLEQRYKHGEFFHADSIKFNDSLKFHTAGGRLVYGGGGIMPDVFVPRDTSSRSAYLYELFNEGTIREYALNYYNDNRKTLEKMSFQDFKENFIITDKMLKDILDEASREGIKFKENEYNRSKDFIRIQTKALIARSVFQKSNAKGKNNEYYQIMADTDEIYTQALKLFDRAKEIERGNFSKISTK
ncbi:MAG: S41 family peptidase [Bacteroidota bacterium]